MGEGRGHRVRQRQRERGGSNGLQDKPTFLKTPRVVITGAKQLNLHTAANMVSLSSPCNKNTPSGYLRDEIRAPAKQRIFDAIGCICMNNKVENEPAVSRSMGQLTRPLSDDGS